MQRNAKFSACRRYRYALWRSWEPAGPKVLFIGLNPSTADETKDDATIRRCIAYAKQWGYGGMIMGNLFAYRSTDPAQLKSAEDPIGPDNDVWLRKLTKQAQSVVAMWGNHGCFLGRHQKVLAELPNPMCFKLTKRGQPHHTRGLPNGVRPVPYQP